jgi:RNAse (barnase) inhibitor barstar
MVVEIDASAIVDRESFHEIFARAFGFPSFYGRNMDAWIDCMTHLDDFAAELSAVHVEPGQVLTLLVQNAHGFKERCPSLYLSLLECAAFVNWRRQEKGGTAVLALSLYG